MDFSGRFSSDVCHCIEAESENLTSFIIQYIKPQNHGSGAQSVDIIDCKNSHKIAYQTLCAFQADFHHILSDLALWYLIRIGWNTWKPFKPRLESRLSLTRPAYGYFNLWGRFH